MYRGYTKAYRKELDSQIWHMSPIYHRVWYVLRQKATHEPRIFPTRKIYGVYVNPGQLITSLRQISEWAAWEEWGKKKVPNIKTIKTILEWLEGNSMITVVSNALGTFIIITNWDIYNCINQEKVTQKEQEKVTISKHLLDTVKECKRIKTKKNNNIVVFQNDLGKIFEYWKKVMNHPRAKLDKARAKNITNIFKIGYTTEDVKKAIDGCANDSFSMGENNRKTVYDDIELICRDAAHIDKFIKNASQPKFIPKKKKDNSWI